MMNYPILLLFVVMASSTGAEIVVPVRTIRAKEIVSADDVSVKVANVSGAVSRLSDVIGMEARVSLYPARPILQGDVGPPAIINRNDIVKLIYLQGSLQITTEGRSLGRGSEGEMIRVMNMVSRMTISGRVQSDGSVEVQ